MVYPQPGADAGIEGYMFFVQSFIFLLQSSLMGKDTLGVINTKELMMDQMSLF